MKSVIESLLLASGEDGLSLDELASIVERDHAEVQFLLNEIVNDYQERGIRLSRIAGRYRFTTLPEHYTYVTRLAKHVYKAAMSKSSLETLAIVAYSQPISRFDVEELRGVRSDRMLQNLQRRGLIVAESINGETHYSTSTAFLECFGLDSISDLPPLEKNKLEV